MLAAVSVTVTELIALELFKLAVICAVPAVLAVTMIDALVWPAGTVMLFGTEAMFDAELLTDTTVSVACTALIVTVKAPVVACVIVIVPGWRLVNMGRGGLTWTELLPVLPFSDTVTWVVPAPTPATGTSTVLWPLANEIGAGPLATPVFVLTPMNVPAADGAGESVAVNVPELPCVMVNVPGWSVLTSGGGGSTCTVLVAVLPF